MQTIGPIGFVHVTGLAYDARDALLYGATGSSNNTPSTEELIRIDRFTGVGTAVGPHLAMAVPDLTFDEAHEQNPAWTPDGRSITFASRRGEASDTVATSVVAPVPT